MGSIDHAIKYETGEVILSVGYYQTQEIKDLYASCPPKYLEAYEPRDPVYTQYLSLCESCPGFRPVNKAVTGDGRDVHLTVRRCSTSVCLPPSHGSKLIKSISLSEVAKAVYSEYGTVDKLLMNCEGSEVDIVLKTPSDVFSLIKTVVVSFHLFVPDFKITEDAYRRCIAKLSRTHTGRLLNESRYWWRFEPNG
jgi:hypothetical protein